MRLQAGLTFFVAIGFCVLCLALAVANANNVRDLHGTWTLVPSGGDFGGQPSIETGTVRIEEEGHNVAIYRDFYYGEGGETESYNFNPDAGKVIRVRNGHVLKTKGEWEGEGLKVTTKERHAEQVERYSLEPDGMLKLVMMRPDAPPVTLFFQRQ